MRDLALVLMMIAGIPLTLRFPFVGLYLWEWFALMNPHRLAYGFAANAPFNLIVAVCTVLAWAFRSDRTIPKANALFVLTAVFAIWISLTTLVAPVPEISTPLWEERLKTLLLMFMIPAVITTRVRLHGLIWIIAISLAYYGVKGGGFTIVSGGSYI